MCHMFTLYMMKNITMTLFAFSKSSPTLKHKDIGCWVKRKHKDIGCWVNNTTSSHENLQSLLPSRQPMTVTFRRAGLRCPPSYVLETGPQKFVPLRDVGVICLEEGKKSVAKKGGTSKEWWYHGKNEKECNEEVSFSRFEHAEFTKKHGIWSWISATKTEPPRPHGFAKVMWVPWWISLVRWFWRIESW